MDLQNILVPGTFRGRRQETDADRPFAAQIRIEPELALALFGQSTLLRACRAGEKTGRYSRGLTRAGATRRVKATFASSSPLSPASQNRLWERCPGGEKYIVLTVT
jgi:hypothetical protein